MGCRSTSCHLQCGAFVRSHNEKTHCSPAHLERSRATFAENLQVKQARRHGVRLTDFGTPQRIAGTMGNQVAVGLAADPHYQFRGATDTWNSGGSGGGSEGGGAAAAAAAATKAAIAIDAIAEIRSA